MKLVRFRYICANEGVVTEQVYRQEDDPPIICINDPNHAISELSIVETITTGIPVDNYGRVRNSPYIENDNFFDKWFKHKIISTEPTDVLIDTEYKYLFEGHFYVDTNEPINIGSDYAVMELIDLDNILGQGAGVIVDTRVEDYLSKCGSWRIFRAMNNQRAELLPGLYMRFRIVHNGPETITGLLSLGMSRLSG